MNKWIRKTLFFALMALFFMPMIQQNTSFFKELSLDGAFLEPAIPHFAIDSIKTGAYQHQVENYQNAKFGFRPFLIKLKNSIDYLLYKKINAADQINGKKGYIYSKSSIERTLGVSYNGFKKNEKEITKINFLKNKLKKHGAKLIAIFAPSKETTLPEFMPELYYGKISDSSDYRDFIRGYRKYNIPHIDFCSYFIKIKDTIPYPLFTKTGFHWSSIAASIAQDTILSFMQQNEQKQMPCYIHLGVEWSDTVRDSEADFEPPMNLLYSLNQKKYVYPRLKMIESSLTNNRPKVIIIGDSFFWQIKNLKLLQNIFSEDSKYWHYFSRSSSSIDGSREERLSDINIIEELHSADFVLLIGSFGTTSDFPFGLTDYYIENVYSPTFVSVCENIVNFNSGADLPVEKENLLKGEIDSLVYIKACKILESKRTFQIKAMNNKYVCADGSKNDILISDKKIGSLWEKFSILRLDENRFAIYSYNNRFLSIEGAVEQVVNAKKSKIGKEELFEIEKLDKNHIAIKASNGKYLSLNRLTDYISATGEKAEENETFEIIYLKE